MVRSNSDFVSPLGGERKNYNQKNSHKAWTPMRQQKPCFDLPVWLEERAPFTHWVLFRRRPSFKPARTNKMANGFGCWIPAVAAWPKFMFPTPASSVVHLTPWSLGLVVVGGFVRDPSSPQRPDFKPLAASLDMKTRATSKPPACSSDAQPFASHGIVQKFPTVPLLWHAEQKRRRPELGSVLQILQVGNKGLYFVPPRTNNKHQKREQPQTPGKKTQRPKVDAPPQTTAVFGFERNPLGSAPREKFFTSSWRKYMHIHIYVYLYLYIKK